jgi:SAM-dependent methyltransferase
MDSSEWEGRVGDLWAEEWRRTDRTFVPVDDALIESAVAQLADVAQPRVLDIGCGAGTTSLSLGQRLSGASITGIDLSAALLGVARSRAVDQPQCSFEQGDASRWAEGNDFDLLVSRHGVMFFDDPVAAFAHLRTRARPGGALIFSCFAAPAENIWATGLANLMPNNEGDPFAPGPFAFADKRHVGDILARAGWQDATARPLGFDYVAGAGEDPVADAISYFRRIGPTARAFRDLDEADRNRLLEGLDTLVRKHRVGDRVSFPAAAWIWSATA